MLKQESKKTEKDNPPEFQISSEASTIGSSLALEGDITGSGDLNVQGRVKGTITLEHNTLVVASTGRVHADIRVKNIDIQGYVEGKIHAAGKVFISKNGRMSGDITARRISIQDGAQFKGSVKMLSSG